MKIRKIVTGDLKQNTYIVTDEKARTGVLIDAGDNAGAILKAIHGYDILYIFLTHTHFDHVLGLMPVYEKTHAKIVVHEAECEIVEKGLLNPPNFFVKKSLPKIGHVQKVSGGETFQVDSLSIRLIHTPGHTAGSMCILISDRALEHPSQALFAGDTLFARGIGRTDLPSGNYDMIMKSIHTILEMQGDIIVYPGHGQLTTISERREDRKIGNLY